MAEPHDEAVRQRALRDWSVDRYAKLAGTGVTWYAGSHPVRNALYSERGDPPNIFDDPSMARRISEDRIFVVDHGGHQVLVVDDDLNIEWSFGEFAIPGSDQEHLDSPRMSHFDEDAGEVLIADSRNNRVLEVEYPSGDVLNTLSSTATGAFGEIWAARYNPKNGNLIITDYTNHYVVETNWNGDVINDFGAYGTSGTDSSHLNSPRFADVWCYGSTPDIGIADEGNDRVLHLDGGTWAFLGAFIAPRPVTFDLGPQSNFMLGSRTQGGFYGPGPMRRVTSRPVWKLTRWGSRIMGSFMYDLFEWDYRFSLPLRSSPISHKMLEDHSLGTNASVERPFLPWDMDKAVITVLSDQDATLDIKTLLPRTCHMTYPQNYTDQWPPEYVNYDSVSLTGGTPDSYVITAPHPAMAFEVTMGGVAGTVNLKVDMR